MMVVIHYYKHAISLSTGYRRNLYSMQLQLNVSVVYCKLYAAACPSPIFLTGEKLRYLFFIGNRILIQRIVFYSGNRQGVQISIPTGDCNRLLNCEQMVVQVIGFYSVNKQTFK
jgi:hypothetical protein